MNYWLSREGYYYELQDRLNDSDMPVPRRPTADHIFINGIWADIKQSAYSHPYNQSVQQYSRRESDEKVQQPHNRRASDHHRVSPAKVGQEGIVLSSTSKVIFGMKEIVMVAAFIITGTLSWQDTNSRILKLEDDKRTLEIKVKSMQDDVAAIITNERNDIQKLTQYLRDVEQLVFMKSKEK